MKSSLTLRDQYGQRKYLIQDERGAFQKEALTRDPSTMAFCLLLLWTGGRIAEINYLQKRNVDVANTSIIIRTLKQKRKIIYREIPIPRELMLIIIRVFNITSRDVANDERLFKWSKRTGQRRVKSVMLDAHIIGGIHACAKAIRHSFAIHCVLSHIPLTTIQKWMGHIYLETTATYLNVMGHEERAIAERIWVGHFNTEAFQRYLKKD